MSIPTRPSARLALEDGTVYRGRAFGAAVDHTGEVVFNTAMAGYQEILTDPSYAGQLVTMTYPLIGNYGVNLQDVESCKPQVEGFVIRELSGLRSNFRSEEELAAYLAKAGVPGIDDLDTRALTCKLRSAGVMRGLLACSEEAAKLPDADLVERARSSPKMEGWNLASKVTCEKAYAFNGRFLSGFGRPELERRPEAAGTDSQFPNCRKLLPVSVPAGKLVSVPAGPGQKTTAARSQAA